MKRWGNRSVAVVLIATGTVAIGACTAPTQEGDRVGTNALAMTAGTPAIDFDSPGPTSKSIALTFDDGPDDNGATNKVLDILKANGLHATFFVNADNYSNVASSSYSQQTLKRMIAEGHTIGNHTDHHYDLSDSTVDVDAEFKAVDDLLGTYTPSFKQVRLARCPFGNPWFGPQSRLDYVAPIVAKYGVHIGWTIDAQDASDCTTTSCVVNNVLGGVDSGLSGVVLMHSVQQITANGLQQIIDGLRTRGVTFVQVEDMVVAKYGAPSRQLFTCSSSAQCVTGETCNTSTHHCTTSGGSTDAGVTDTGTTDTGTTDTGTTDTGTTDTGVTDSGGGGGGGSSATLSCSSFTVTSGSIGGASTACGGTSPTLAANDATVLEYNPSSTSTKADGYATYVSPFSASQVTGISVTVAYRGDDKTEPAWYWYARNATTGAWDLLGDDAWASDWATTAHTFTLSSPSRYVDASGHVLVRFTTTASTNNAELNEMIVQVTGSTGATDAGTSDAGPADTGAADTAVDDTGAVEAGPTDTGTSDTGATDTGTTDTGAADTGTSGDATPVTSTVTCSALTKVSGALYGSVTTACSGTSPSLSTANGSVVGWSGSASATKASAYATYVSPAPAASVTAMNLVVAYRGDDKTEPSWSWYAQNASTGAWELVGDDAFAGDWVSTSHTFAVANPARYVAADGTVRILFTTTSSTNDAELDRMVVEITH